MIDDWHGRRVTVMGLGRFGGGVGVSRWLAERGATVTVTDQAPAEALAPSLDELRDLDLTLHLGGHRESDFHETDLVVVNPAVKPTSPYLQVAELVGVPVTTEINLFAERCPARVVGVTGSVGKSTTTAMIGQVLAHCAQVTENAPRVWVGGNIGRSLLGILEQIRDADVVVLELSSFQLERTTLVSWSPHVAVITNLTPNHLDWHGDLAAYAAAKLNIARHQDPARDVVILGPTLGEEARHLTAEGHRVWQFDLDDDTPLVRTATDKQRWPALQLSVPGRHNRENAAAALAVAHALAVPTDAALAALGEFEALPHRLQRVAERAGVTYFDDSKSTTPEAALTALAAFDTPLLLILGGYDKGSDLAPLAAVAAGRARFSACIGTTGPALAAAIRGAGGAAEDCGELSRAVAACQARARAGDVVLLSPACASWDQFSDYRLRGETFARLVCGTDAGTP